MRIATWNIERLKHKKSIQDIVFECESRKADILVLTETDSQVMPKYNSCFQTASLKDVIDIKTPRLIQFNYSSADFAA